MKTNCDSTTSNETSIQLFGDVQLSLQKGQKTQKAQETVTLFCAHFPEWESHVKRGALNANPSILLLTAGIRL